MAAEPDAALACAMEPPEAGVEVQVGDERTVWLRCQCGQRLRVLFVRWVPPDHVEVALTCDGGHRWVLVPLLEPVAAAHVWRERGR